MRVRHAALPALLTATALAAPAGAQAATLTAAVTKPCYGAADRVGLSGAGFTPNSAVTLVQGQIPLRETAPADAAGAFSGSAGVQQINTNEETTPYSAIDQAAPGFVVAQTVPIRFSRVLVGGRKAGANGLIQKIRARGFTSGKRVLFMHVRRGGRNVKTLRLGRLKGACRTISVRKRLFTARAARANPGTYQLYFDTSRRYRKARRQQVRAPFRVFQITRPAAAGAVATTSATSAFSGAIGSWRPAIFG